MYRDGDNDYKIRLLDSLEADFKRLGASRGVAEALLIFGGEYVEYPTQDGRAARELAIKNNVLVYEIVKEKGGKVGIEPLAYKLIVDKTLRKG